MLDAHEWAIAQTTGITVKKKMNVALDFPNKKPDCPL
jgi:hypothetical protein